jgi:hypothetical protein
MISYRRRRDASKSLQENNEFPRVMRTFLYGLREKTRPIEVLERVLREGPNDIKVAVGKREK